MINRILIDLTDLEHWQGIHGGIQRVVYGIAKEFYLDSASYEIAFVLFDDKNKVFIHTDFKPIMERTEKTATSELSNSSVEPQGAGDATGSRDEHKYRNGFFKIAHGYKNIMSLFGVSKTSASETETHTKQVVFKPGDTVLVLGKPWDNLDIQRTLSGAKKVHSIKITQVVYDLVISLHPHLQNPILISSFNEHMTMVVRDSDLLLCISESTKSDVLEFAKLQKIGPPPAKVIRLADALDETSLTHQECPDPRLKEPFIACVGTVEIRKNHALLYYAYKLAKERGIDLPPTVIVGGRGWLTGDIQYMIEADLEVKKKIFILDKVEDNGLAWVYKNCLMTVYPSMYEGWGLPVAESLAYGKLAISSESSSMPEIGGELAEYFSPYSPEQLLDRIVENLATSKRSKKEEQIKQHYRTTDWRQTYTSVMEYIKEMNEKN